MINENLINKDHKIIEVKNLKKYYPSGGKTLKALDGVSFEICEGEIMGVVGESGCGKSTLGRSVLRLFPITEGEILFDGTDISRMNRRELKPYRKNMQMIFQNPYSSFNPKQKIGSALYEVGRVYGMDERALHEKVEQLMEYISLPLDMLHRSPGELSGGQLQRLAIARALILEPGFIVADEPVSALDVSVQAQILNLITDLRKKLKMTMMFISHEMTVVEHICDNVAVMYLGRIVEMAPVKELFSNICHPYTQALMSAIPKADPEDAKERIILEGDIPNAIDLPRGCSFASRCRYCTQQCREKAPELKDIGNGHKVACYHV
ncbi:MAG: oligopeptide/dipeptide ABC transporter ATP-binding protein [Blautia sp.]|nr:oligopeptide/dipeptide ABC transporter ATP-binding protein [Blautia sp.]